jgi:hypothetical protein
MQPERTPPTGPPTAVPRGLPPPQSSELARLFAVAGAQWLECYPDGARLPPDFVRSTFECWLAMPVPDLVALHPQMITIRYLNGTLVERAYDRRTPANKKQAGHDDRFALRTPSSPEQTKLLGPQITWPPLRVYTMPGDCAALQKQLRSMPLAPPPQPQ